MSSLGRELLHWSTVETIASEVRELEPKQQSQVLPFIQAPRKQNKHDEEKAFAGFALAAAMRADRDSP